MNRRFIGLFLLLTILSISSVFAQDEPGPKNLVRLKITGGQGADEFVVYFDPEATDGYDASVDAIKMLSGNPGVPNIYGRIGEDDISINVMGDFNIDKTVPVAVKIAQNGVYNISVLELNHFEPTTMVYLEDSVQSKFFNLLTEKSLNFNLITSVYVGRFFLHFKLPLKITTQNETCKQNDGKIIINNPSESPWNLKLLSADGLTPIDSADSVVGDTLFNGLDGKDYNLLISKPDPYSQIIPLTIEPAIEINPEFSVSPNDTVLQGQPVRFEAQQLSKYINYKWDIGDGNIYNDTSSYVEHIYLAPGVYTVFLTIEYGTCSDFSSQAVVVKPDNITNIINNNPDFTIYPNPTRDYLIIDNSKFKSIEITDVYGKKCQNFYIIKNSEKNSKIDVSLLNGGVYFISITDEKKIAKFKLYKID